MLATRSSTWRSMSAAGAGSARPSRASARSTARARSAAGGVRAPGAAPGCAAAGRGCSAAARAGGRARPASWPGSGTGGDRRAVRRPARRRPARSTPPGSWPTSPVARAGRPLTLIAAGDRAGRGAVGVGRARLRRSARGGLRLRGGGRALRVARTGRRPPPGRRPRRSPAEQLAFDAGARRARRRQDVHGLEQVGLALAVAAAEEQHARAGLEAQAGKFRKLTSASWLSHMRELVSAQSWLA